MVSEYQVLCIKPEASFSYLYKARLSKYAQSYMDPAKTQPKRPEAIKVLGCRLLILDLENGKIILSHWISKEEERSQRS